MLDLNRLQVKVSVDQHGGPIRAGAKPLGRDKGLRAGRIQDARTLKTKGFDVIAHEVTELAHIGRVFGQATDSRHPQVVAKLLDGSVEVGARVLGDRVNVAAISGSARSGSVRRRHVSSGATVKIGAGGGMVGSSGLFFQGRSLVDCGFALCLGAAVALLAGCGATGAQDSGIKQPGDASVGGLDTTFGADGSGTQLDGAAGDGTVGSDSSASGDAAADSTTDADGADVADTIDVIDPDADGGADALSDGNTVGDTVSDGADGDVTQVGPQNPVGTLYAHTENTLYKLGLATKTFAKVAVFAFDKNKGSVTDIALDKVGTLYAITFDDVFVCNELTASCKWLAELPQSFNGLTFVPAGTVDPNDEALIGIGNAGTWNHIKVSGGKATIKLLGTYGGGWSSSGDAFSVSGIGTYATVNKAGSSGDSLVQVDPKTGKIQKVIGQTAASSLWGLAWWGGVFYGFSGGVGGGVYTIDAATGKSTKVTAMKVPSGAQWWGAGVSTRAAGGL